MRQNLVLSLVIFALVSLLAACGGKPEEKIADHIEEMSEICEDNMDSPEDGVKELRGYLHDNLPDMMEQVGEALVELDKIEDDGERKERLEEMTKALEEAVKNYGGKCESFAEKAMGDEGAMKEVMAIQKRFEMLGDLGGGMPF